MEFTEKFGGYEGGKLWVWKFKEKMGIGKKDWDWSLKEMDWERVLGWKRG